MADTANTVASHPLPDPARVNISDRIVVRVSGPGTDKFLQGQFSQQVGDVTPGYSPRAAACTPKGRAYCLTRLVRSDNDILMELQKELADETISHLRKYLMLFRGTSMEVEPGAGIVGLMGNSPAEALLPEASRKLTVPGASELVAGGHLVRTMDTAEGMARFEFWQTGPLPEPLQQALNGIPEATLADWHGSEIAAGVAALAPATKESFVPQMLNWQHLGGIHFKKGCYTGQEVIARMHFLGQLKKSLYRFTCNECDTLPAPGDAILDGERSVGNVVRAVRFSDNSVELLAVVRHDAAGHTLVAEGAPSATLTLSPIPYPVPEREQNDTSDT